MKKQSCEVHPVGEVEVENGRFIIKIDDEYKDAMKELEGFTHIQVLWWFHLTDSDEFRSYLAAPKPYKNGPEEIGMFATRSPVRPNPIGLTIVPVLGIDQAKGEIEIAFIDAEKSSPVLDIKPYYGIDRVKELSVPDWCSH